MYSICISNIYVIKKQNIAIVWFVHWLVHWFIAEVWTHIHLTIKNCGCWSFPPLTWRVSQKKRCQLFLDCQRITFLGSLILFPCLKPSFLLTKSISSPFKIHENRKIPLKSPKSHDFIHLSPCCTPIFPSKITSSVTGITIFSQGGTKRSSPARHGWRAPGTPIGWCPARSLTVGHGAKGNSPSPARIFFWGKSQVFFLENLGKT